MIRRFVVPINGLLFVLVGVTRLTSPEAGLKSREITTLEGKNREDLYSPL